MSVTAVVSERRRTASTEPLRRVMDVRFYNALLVTAVVAVIAVMGYRRRWLADDGMIYTRAVRQILAGHGPVFNVNERAESSTGTLWQWLLAGIVWISRADPGKTAVYAGLVLSVAGFALAMLGGIRLGGRGRVLLPAGVLVLVALPPVWDFATSGLETGLTTFWSGLSWLLLVRPRRRGAAAFVFGLGFLVRPDLAIPSAVFLVALWLTHRPPWRTTIGWTGAALALPLAYEVFRAGFYGELVPLPAVAKSASRSVWGRGWTYLGDFVTPYRFWIPVLLLVALAAVVGRGGRREMWPVIAAGPVSGALMILYTVRVGGDFMHARMILPGLFMALLPILVVPASRTTAALAALVAVWAGLCAAGWRVPYQGIGPQAIADERSYWVAALGSPNPISGADHTRPDPEASQSDANLIATGRRWLTLAPGPGSQTGELVPLRDGLGVRLAHSGRNLGSLGAQVPPDQMAVDVLGLAYPLAAHMQAGPPGRAGHDKAIPPLWVVADLGEPGVVPPEFDASQLAAARHALTCGALADLQASARAPLTFDRFMHNLFGAFDRTRLVVPTDPYAAERKFCGTR